MKKILCLTLMLFLLFGCVSHKEESKVTVLVPYGIPLIAVGGLIGDDHLTIEAVSGPDLLISGLIAKSHDIIIAPVNLGVKLYQTQTEGYLLEALVSFGNIYVASRITEPLADIMDLNGKTILSYGKNTVPDFVLNSAMRASGINADITYQNSVDMVVPFFLCHPDKPDDVSCNPPDYIVTAEPILSKLEMVYGMELNVLDLEKALEGTIDAIPQAALFINPQSCNSEPVHRVLEMIKDNITEANLNPQAYGEKIVNRHQYFRDLTTKVISGSIIRSRIRYLKAKDHWEMCSRFFKQLYDFNPGLIGVTIDEELYAK